MGPRARPCRYNGLEPKTSSRVRGKNGDVAQAAARRLGLSLSRKVRLGRELRENSTLTAEMIFGERKAAGGQRASTTGRRCWNRLPWSEYRPGRLRSA